MSKVCEKCRRQIPDGGLAYEVSIQVVADFDGHLPEAGDGAALEQRLREVTAQALERDPDALMRDVYHAERHLLCPVCRDRYVANPLNLLLSDDTE